MSELGLIASKFNINTASLREFDDALRLLRKERRISRTVETAGAIERLVRVVHPIAEGIRENLTDSTAITERSVIEMIKELHSRTWATYKERIIRLDARLNSEEIQLDEDDIATLDDIADALDSQCANLFNRMGNGR